MSLKRTILLFVCSCFSIGLFSQEICNNGIDDDSDGLVDLNDDDCKCESFMPSSLIPNPSFEEMSCCPEGEAQLNCANDWIQASAATTDYVHECGILGLPFINAEAPLPFPDGQGAIGFRDGKPTDFNFKEYTGACLMQPLMAGQDYMLDFFVGFQDNVEGSMNLEMAVFASMDCSNLLFGGGDPNFGCPTNGAGFVLLGEMEYSGNNEWVNATFEFTPDQDYNVIVIGPSCLLNENLELDPYFFFDNIILAQADEFGLPIVDITGAPCGEELTLQSSDKIEGEFQWYKDGVALVGETGASLTIMDPSNQADPQDGIYQVTVTTGSDCFLGDEYELSFTTTMTNLDLEVCEGDTIIIGDEEITSGGFYEIILQSVITQCDSLLQIMVSEGDMPEETIEASICSGASYELNGEVYDESGTFIQTIERDSACDSLLTLELAVMVTDSTFENASFCAGSSIIIGGEEYDEAGTVIQNFSSSSDCDSVVVTAITELPAQTSQESASFCQGSSIIIGDEEYTEAGNYTQNFTSQDGCDSILQVTLTTIPQDSTLLETSICPGESVLISGQEYTEPGVYTQTFTNQATCDSIITIIIENENGCVDCDLTEEGNFKTKVDITKMISGNFILQINDLQSIEIGTTELEEYIRTFTQEEKTKDQNGVLKALYNKDVLSNALLNKYRRPTVELPDVQEETTKTVSALQEMKAGRTMSYWISI